MNNRIIIFSRYPVPGITKTRLIPSLGPAGAADFQWSLILKTFNTVKKFSAIFPVKMEVCLDGGSPEIARRLFGNVPIYSEQPAGDLGKRMYLACLKAFADGCKHVILLGTDVPELETRHLTSALEGLQSNDVVIGPSTDGGYWLVGMNYPFDIFTNIPWGTATVFAHTLAKIRKAGLRVHVTEPLTDIDTPENLVHFFTNVRARYFRLPYGDQALF